MAFLKKRGDTWYLYWTQDGKKHGRSLKTNRKTLAEQYLARFELQLAQRELDQAINVSLDRLAEEYLAYSKATKKQSTLDRHETPRITRFIKFLKDQELQKPSEIRTSHMQTYQQKLLESLKPVTARHCMFAASGVLAFALQRGYIQSNVARNVVKPKAVKNPPRFLSIEEWKKVQEVARKTPLWPLVATAYYAGFRNSELRFLTWPEIDFQRDVITLINKEGFTLKNRESRTVPLNGELKAILQPLRRDGGYCFTNARGQQWDDRELSTEFGRLIAKPSGLAHFSLHTLRHTFASHLVMKGVSIFKVSQWLGHRSVNTTMIYAHLAPQDEQINVLGSPAPAI